MTGDEQRMLGVRLFLPKTQIAFLDKRSSDGGFVSRSEIARRIFDKEIAAQERSKEILETLKR